MPKCTADPNITEVVNENNSKRKLIKKRKSALEKLREDRQKYCEKRLWLESGGFTDKEGAFKN